MRAGITSRSGLAGRCRIRRRNDAVCPAVEAFAPRVRALMQETFELRQAATIHIALEFDHVLQGYPVVVPTPGIEFRLLGCAQTHIAVAPDEAQQIPDLLLPTIASAPLTLD